MIGAGFGVLYISSIYVRRYFERPLVMTMGRDFINWNTTFPGFTICSQNTINETAMGEYLRFGAHAILLDSIWPYLFFQSKIANETPVLQT